MSCARAPCLPKSIKTQQGGNALSTQKNTEKLTEKAFSRLWITSIAGIVLCIEEKVYGI
jgi:hypothetical protein